MSTTTEDRWPCVEDALNDLEDVLASLSEQADTALAMNRWSFNATGEERQRLVLHRPMRPGTARATRQAERMWEAVRRRVEGEMRHAAENGDGDGGGPSDVGVERLFDVVNVARACLELAADAELENSYGVSPRTMFNVVLDYMSPAFEEARDRLGVGKEQALDEAGQTLKALAAEVEGENPEEGE